MGVAFQLRMKVALVLLLGLVCLASANHIGYIAYFPSSDCSGDAYAISPLFPGASSFCPAAGETCLRTLSGLTQPGLNCNSRDYQAATVENVEGIRVDGVDFIPYRQCQSSSDFTGCSYQINPTTLPFEINGGPIPTESGFVSFLSYTDQGCGTFVVDMRVPIFEGTTEICEAVATSCTGSLRGFSLPRNDNGRICTSATRSLINGDCTVSIDAGLATEDIRDLGDCENSPIFNACTDTYSRGNGLYANCDASDTYVEDEDDDFGVVGDDDDEVIPVEPEDDDEIVGIIVDGDSGVQMLMPLFALAAVMLLL